MRIFLTLFFIGIWAQNGEDCNGCKADPYDNFLCFGQSAYRDCPESFQNFSKFVHIYEYRTRVTFLANKEIFHSLDELFKN